MPLYSPSVTSAAYWSIISSIEANSSDVLSALSVASEDVALLAVLSSFPLVPLLSPQPVINDMDRASARTTAHPLLNFRIIIPLLLFIRSVTIFMINFNE